MLKANSLPRFLGWISLVLGPLAVFAIFLLIVKTNPLEAYAAMLRSTVGDLYGLGEVAVRAAPLILTALAATVPARARLINVGGEGQLAIGALMTAAVAMVLGDRWPQAPTLILLALAGMAGGAAWAGLAGILRVKLKLNETIGTLLLNYIAFLFVGYMVHGLLKDPASFNWPFSPPLAEVARFPTLPLSRVHLGILIAPIVAGLVWYFTTHTYWGLRLRVVGGNPEAARRAGLNVERIQFMTMLVGGMLAGLAGMIVVTGVEGRLRPATGVGLGYVGFLAAWMVSQHPLWLIGSSILLAIITVSGDTLQITSGLPASSVNILMALVLLGVLARFYREKKST